MAYSFYPCSIDGCNRSAMLADGGSSGLCRAHNHKRARYGTPYGGRQQQPKSCTADGCVRAPYARGLCTLHYQRWKKHGVPVPKTTERALPTWKFKREYEKPCLVDGCRRFRYSRGFCRSHYDKWKRYGDPLADNTKVRHGLQWLWDNINYEGNDCLTWPFCKDWNGRPKIGMTDGTTTASRLMCQMAHGPAPTPKHQAAHSCGKGHEACCNPRHLRWATPKENIADQNLHGLLYGQKSWAKKLTKDELDQVLTLLKKCL